MLGVNWLMLHMLRDVHAAHRVLALGMQTSRDMRETASAFEGEHHMLHIPSPHLPRTDAQTKINRRTDKGNLPKHWPKKSTEIWDKDLHNPRRKSQKLLDIDDFDLRSLQNYYYYYDY